MNHNSRHTLLSPISKRKIGFTSNPSCASPPPSLSLICIAPNLAGALVQITSSVAERSPAPCDLTLEEITDLLLIFALCLLLFKDGGNEYTSF